MGNNNVQLNITGNVELLDEDEVTQASSVTNNGGNNSSANGKVTLRERLSSRALWVSLAGLTVLILEAAGVFKKMGITNDTWTAIVTALGAVLSAFGIMNNPTDKVNF